MIHKSLHLDFCPLHLPLRPQNLSPPAQGEGQQRIVHDVWDEHLLCLIVWIRQ